MALDGSPDDTICAIATPVGEGGIGIVRISGPNATHVAHKVVRFRSNQSFQAAASHMLRTVDIFGPPHTVPRNESPPDEARFHSNLIDQGLAVYMKGPRSFTGEDVVEIHCHGSGIALKRVCEACVVAGARLAQPGEFTKRAFLNGRLDLSQAEAVLDTITAKSELGLKMAQRHLRGALGQQVTGLRNSLMAMLAHVEAGIDFSDEDISFVGRQELIASLEDTRMQIQRMVSTAETGRILREGGRIAIVGKPNVGKSSLLNALLQENRAIVTDIPGTTRDLIEDSVEWQGLRLTFVDTAGLRDTSDVVEQEGIRRSRMAQEDSDLVLHVVDAAEVGKTAIAEFVSPGLAHHDVIVVNKMDLVNSGSVVQLCEALSQDTAYTVVPISVRTGEGLEELKRVIEALFLGPSLEASDGLIITNLRHRLALERAMGSLDQALTSVGSDVQPEFVAVDLRGASDALGEVVGDITSDDILNRIFSEFCIGK
ncbi:MAG: tRNA uridine-5-carboxymethylaminomethyl(34) synthesis GTPase MnmE [Nitrospira sp.]|nr:tRNA uridine-5-carboxymethylaminomethyl(34) synthesis GTPase MnmE [Nitrospira sp.]